jgi:hypothetical protein
VAARAVALMRVSGVDHPHFDGDGLTDIARLVENGPVAQMFVSRNGHSDGSR